MKKQVFNWDGVEAREVEAHASALERVVAPVHLLNTDRYVRPSSAVAHRGPKRRMLFGVFSCMAGETGNAGSCMAGVYVVK